MNRKKLWFVWRSRWNAANAEIIAWIREEYPELLMMDGFDDCIIGVCDRYGQESIVAYDKEKVIRKLMKRKNVS